VNYPAGFTARPPARREDAVVTWNASGTPEHGSVVAWFGDSFGNAREEGVEVVGHGAIDIMAPIGGPVVLTTDQRVVEYWLYRGRDIAGVTRTGTPEGSPEYSADAGWTIGSGPRSPSRRALSCAATMRTGAGS
jgi:hypothetical protein